MQLGGFAQVFVEALAGGEHGRAAHDAEGLRQPDVNAISETQGFDGLIALLRRLATRRPAHADVLLARGPQLEVTAAATALHYDTPLGRVSVRAREQDDPVATLLRTLPATPAALAPDAVRQDLVDTLLATGVLAPSWATRASLPALLYAASSDG